MEKITFKTMSNFMGKPVVVAVKANSRFEADKMLQKMGKKHCFLRGCQTMQKADNSRYSLIIGNGRGAVFSGEGKTLAIL